MIRMHIKRADVDVWWLSSTVAASSYTAPLHLAKWGKKIATTKSKPRIVGEMPWITVNHLEGKKIYCNWTKAMTDFAAVGTV